MWKLGHKESWVLKNWCFWTVVLEKTLENPLDCKDIKLVNPKGNQPWIFIGRTDAEAVAPILWPPDVKNRLIEKDPDAEKDWGQEKKGVTEDEIVGWHHWLDRHEFEQTPGAGEGQGSLACCYPWGCKDSNMTEQLKNNNNRDYQKQKPVQIKVNKVDTTLVRLIKKTFQINKIQDFFKGGTHINVTTRGIQNNKVCCK